MLAREVLTRGHVTEKDVFNKPVCIGSAGRHKKRAGLGPEWHAALWNQLKSGTLAKIKRFLFEIRG